MKKLKVFMFVALFGAMSFGAFSAYNYTTMSAEERFLLANVEALTSYEPGGGGGGGTPYCHNGGKGSTACSIEGGIDILGSGVSAACSVSCSGNYYSCCGLRCTCVPN